MKSLGGSQTIGPPLSYPIGFRRQGLLHILLHSQGGGMAPAEWSLLFNQSHSGVDEIFLKCDSVHHVLRGWWGDPWGFESPLRHYPNNQREPGTAPGSLFSLKMAKVADLWLGGRISHPTKSSRSPR